MFPEMATVQKKNVRGRGGGGIIGTGGKDIQPGRETCLVEMWGQKKKKEKTNQ